MAVQQVTREQLKAAIPPKATPTEIKMIAACVRAANENQLTKERVAELYAAETGKEFSAKSVPGSLSGLRKRLREAGRKSPFFLQIGEGKRGRRKVQLSDDAAEAALADLLDDIDFADESESESENAA